ncbi:DUF3224 domain-containing protein [Nakamurella flavida]|uniref:DUF3224 domain-containing protein n=1 Tax=Nakamurella flavida TaxID=363630 RepID=A0A939C221_9ACTN|nr:DUF3224 domain-containing protein [Nakamurella flavida]MBM9478288.1 DUF3224 domain-containing protein [Nakamurella flavida]MDP9777541.1 hypothetical protein [Nakamurella flavida]
MTRLELPFTLDRWDATSTEDGPGEETAAMAVVALAKTYRGDELTATATGHALTTRGPLGAAYVAQERITGTLLGRTGSFVLEHGASMGEGVETESHAAVVAGSGTGELAGIAGTGLMEHELLTLDVELPEG